MWRSLGLGPALIIASLLAPAQAQATRTRVQEALEKVIQRNLSQEELKDLNRMEAGVPARQGSTILFCAVADADFFIGASISGCVDARLNRYYILSGGAGFSVGASVSTFMLVYSSYSGESIVGTYYGGRWGFAYGFWGGALGTYFRAKDKTLTLERHNPARSADRLYWLGYVAGGAFDISSSILEIGRL